MGDLETTDKPRSYRATPPWSRNVNRTFKHPWWWRARRKIAYKVGLDWNFHRLGYLIDVNRDRHRPDDWGAW